MGGVRYFGGIGRWEQNKANVASNRRHSTPAQANHKRNRPAPRDRSAGRECPPSAWAAQSFTFGGAGARKRNSEKHTSVSGAFVSPPFFARMPIFAGPFAPHGFSP